MVNSLRQGRLARHLSAVAAVGAIALAMAACSGSNGTPTAVPTGSTDPTALSGTVNWWGWSPTADAAKQYITEFNKTYPNVKVNYKLLPTDGVAALLRPALASGAAGPDVFGLTPGPQMSEFGGYAADLTPVVEKTLGSDWKSKIAASGIDTLTSDGKLRALSLGSIFGGILWINQDLFDQYGVKAPKTLSEWEDACKVFASHNVGCFVQGAGQLGFNQDTLQSIADSVQPGAWTKASKGEMKWTDPVFVKTLTIFKSLFSDGIMEPGALAVQQYPDANNQFLSGKYAMIQMGTWYMQNAAKPGMTSNISAAGVGNPKPFTAVPILFPDVAGAGNAPSLFGEADFGLAVNAKSKVLDAAAAFVTWMTTSKTAQQLVANQLNDFPSLVGVSPDWNSIQLVDAAKQQPALDGLLKQTATVDEPREALFNADMQTAVQAAATSVAAGGDPAQALATLQAAAVKAGVTFTN